jgi:hypothetical protein
MQFRPPAVLSCIIPVLGLLEGQHSMGEMAQAETLLTRREAAAEVGVNTPPLNSGYLPAS